MMLNMIPFASMFCLLLDIAPMSWAPLFLVPALIIAVVVVAIAVLASTIRRRQEEISDKKEALNDKGPDSKA